jgi:hypothetical protein
MNLREIDRLVAEKVMGWKIFVSRNVDTGTVSEFYDDGENLIGVREWFPTLDIQDAWQVVEKLKITVIPQAGDPPKNMKYLAEIDRRPLGGYYEAFAETAQLAICSVALKAHGVDVNDYLPLS